MKKRQAGRPPFAMLLVLTVLAIGGMRYYDHTVRQAVPTVTVTVVEKRTVNETVTCTGTVAAAEGVEVFAKMPCVAGSVDVSVGDRVNKGDVLVTVDRNATLSMALGSAMTVNASAVSSLEQAVVAPADGIVSAVSASEGELIDPTSPCVVLSDKAAVEIAVVIRESALPKVKTGQEVTVSGVAFDKRGYRGTITDMASSARSRVNGTSGETVVDAVVSLYDGEADESLLVGLSAKASVTVATHEDVLLIPYECVVQNDAGVSSVYCYDGTTVSRRDVVTAGEFADGVMVTDGLCEGERVVTDPQILETASIWCVAEGKT